MAELLHTRVRVGDLDRSIAFYTDHLGFRMISRSDRSPHGNHIAHLELPGNAHTIELTWSKEYDLSVPEDLMHFAIGVPDLVAFCCELESRGVDSWPDGWRQEFEHGRKMAFIDDPDGYEIELLERTQ